MGNFYGFVLVNGVKQKVRVSAPSQWAAKELLERQYGKLLGNVAHRDMDAGLPDYVKQREENERRMAENSRQREENERRSAQENSDQAAAYLKMRVEQDKAYLRFDSEEEEDAWRADWNSHWEMKADAQQLRMSKSVLSAMRSKRPEIYNACMNSESLDELFLQCVDFMWEIGGKNKKSLQKGIFNQLFGNTTSTNVEPEAANIGAVELATLRSMAEASVADEQFRLAIQNDENDTSLDYQRKSVRLYSLAAGRGHLQALVNLAFSYFDGKLGLEKDETEAARLFKLAAEGGHPDAQLVVADGFQEGRNGFPRNESEWLRFLRMAADQWTSIAQFQLAEIKRNGSHGIEKNEPEALRLYETSAKNGEVRSILALAEICERGALGVPINGPKAIDLYTRAIREGSSEGQYHLGRLYKFGLLGLEKDLNRAKNLLEMAASRGSIEAQEELVSVSSERAPTDNPAGLPSQQHSAEQIAGGSRLEALERLAKLRDSGALTQKEFEQEKKLILQG